MKHEVYDESGLGRSLGKAEANGGYIWVENAFIKNYLPQLSGLATRVYLYLIRYTPQKGYEPLTWKALPVSKIAGELNTNRTSVFQALRELEDHQIIRRFQEEPGAPNRFHLLELT